MSLEDENCGSGSESFPSIVSTSPEHISSLTSRLSCSEVQSGIPAEVMGFSRGGSHPPTAQSPAALPSFLPPEAQTPCPPGNSLRPGLQPCARVAGRPCPIDQFGYAMLMPESRWVDSPCMLETLEVLCRPHRCSSTATGPKDDTLLRNSPLLQAGCYPTMPDLNATSRLSAEARLEIAQIPAENPCPLSQQAKPPTPDYLRRTKRSPIPSLDGPLQPAPNIRIIDSPVKGRRLALFQATSEESFEESLMAGGYGRYRLDALPWRQPENEPPIPITTEPSLTTEREKKKKSRLAAFLDVPRASSSKTQLIPSQVEGCGRVLVTVDVAEPSASPRPSSSKGKRSRKKKKAALDLFGGWDGVLAPSQTKLDGPNWPDTQFPWGPRFAHQSPEEEERLRCIESFLDRDSDEDDAQEGASLHSRSPAEEAQPSKGKMYPHSFHLADDRKRESGSTMMASDPADARTVLLSKKSVREFYLRLLRRRNADSDGYGEAVCICNEPDDDRAAVQCDLCCTWYHLDCIGIQSTAELGREEDPWFCGNCAESKTPPPVGVPLPEPTFVPTDEVNVNAAYDPPFFHGGTNASPNTVWASAAQPPRTPPRCQAGPYFSSGSSWDEPSCRGGPHTPQLGGSEEVRVYTTPGRAGMLALESPFDPTSTPSRGIRFGAPFATPKDGAWVGRPPELFHTPTRPGGIAIGRYLAPHGSKGGEQWTSTVPAVPSLVQDITPVGHAMKDGGRAMESPLAGKRAWQGVDIRLSTTRRS